jgi:hypothetical protein
MSTFEVLSLLSLLGVFVWGSITISNRVAAERAQDFVGTVVDRQHNQVTLTTGVRHDFWLMVRKDDDQVIAWPVNGSVYQNFAVGDRVVKRAGDRWPVKG